MTTNNSLQQKLQRFIRSWRQWQSTIDLKTKVALLAVTIALSTLGVVWWHWDIPFASPISEAASFRFFNQENDISDGKIVYGYLPYWNIGKTAVQPELTDLSYFGLTLQADGTFQTRAADGYLEPGYSRLNSETLLTLLDAHRANNRDGFEITIPQFNNDDIVAFLNSKTAQQTFFESLDSVLLAYPITGVNIDIEYSGQVTDQLRANFATFMADLDQHLDTTYEDINLSIAMYASAGARRTIWDVAAIAPSVDHIVVMAYDFHQRNSVIAGPVAPLLGGKEFWDSDIAEYIAAYLDVVPSEKIVLGIPFYGYEWQTTSRESGSNTFPDSGSTASFERVQSLLAQQEELQVEEHWNEDALSPYISYVEDGEIFVVYYENSRSISYKLDLVNQLDLAGVAIWALGYEGDSRELWDVINRKL